LLPSVAETFPPSASYPADVLCPSGSVARKGFTATFDKGLYDKVANFHKGFIHYAYRRDANLDSAPR
jgi:hypothetical protein